jgi:hypothetical protein
MSERQESGLVISYMTLRQMIGVLGVFLPVVVVLGGGLIALLEVRPSISAYYYSNMRDLFVGVLCMVGVFLISYKGYDRLDHYTSNFSGVLAIVVALFPTQADGQRIEVGISQLSDGLSGRIHNVCAALLFASLAFISTFLFTKTSNEATMTEQKKARNRIYRVCGAIMFGALFVAFLFSLPVLHAAAPYHLVLAVETVSLWAFGFSWLVKGQAILRDYEVPSTSMEVASAPR